MMIFKDGIKFLKEIFANKFLLYELTKRDFRDRYLGSYLGLLWALLDPLIMMLLMWFVFAIGLKGSRPGAEYPFVAYLFTGMIAYNFFCAAVGTATSVVRSYSFLVRKVNFRVSVLPLVKIISALIMHVIFIGIVIPIVWFSGVAPSWYWFQGIYYLLAMLVLLMGICWLLAAIGVFVEDMPLVVGIVTRLLFWLTPIFWNIRRVPEKFQVYLKINPLFYIVEGYRKSFLYCQPFWDEPLYMSYFWALSMSLLVVGVLVFRRLRPHFEAML